MIGSPSRAWKHIPKLIKNLFTLTWDSLATLRQKTAPDEDVCLMVRMDAIGDFVIWYGECVRLCEVYSSKRRVLVANVILQPLIESYGLFHEVIGVDITRFTEERTYRTLILKRIRSIGCAIAIQPTFSRALTLGDSIVRVSGARKKIGFDCDNSNMAGWQKLLADRWYTELVRLPSNAVINEFEINSIFTSHFFEGRKKCSYVTLPAVGRLPPDLSGVVKYCVISPGAGDVGRRWPDFYFRELAEFINKKYGYIIVVCGTVEDSSAAQTILSGESGRGSLDLTARCSLSDFIEVVRQADLLLGNDSSSVHIAAAVGTPSVNILGGGHFSRFFPYPDIDFPVKPKSVFRKMDCYQCNWRCSKILMMNGVFPCVAQITPSDVIGVLVGDDGTSLL